MALEEYDYLMIDSEDFWGYDSSTFNDKTNWYGKVFVVSKQKIEENPNLIQELNLMPCAMFFLIGAEDSQRFRPTRIQVDKERMVAVIEGVQKRIGQDTEDVVRPMLFRLNGLAPIYKNMNEYGKMTLGRFKVDNMIFSSTDGDFKKPKARLEELTQYAESFGEDKVVAEAEFFNAETLERINPTIVEGAEDIMGAENETFKSSNSNAIIMKADGDGVLADTNVFGPVVNDNVIGQEYVGRVLGQDAESAFYPNGDGRNFGNITADGQYEPLGANAEGVENDILSAEFNAEANEVTIHTLKGEQFTVNTSNGILKNAEGVFDAEESEALSAEDMTLVMNAAGYVPSGEWGSMNPESANQTYMWEFRNAEEVPSGEWGSMNPESANQTYMWEFRNAEDREAQGYDDRDDESIGMRHKGKHKQSLKDRRDESKAMTAKGDPHHPYADVGTMDAEFFPDGDGRNFGNVTAEMQMDPLGFNAQGYDDRDDESIGMRHKGKHKQSLKDRRDESKAMTSKGDPHHPYADVGTMDAEYITEEGVLMGAAENTRVLLSDKDTDIIDVVQDAPIIRDFKLSGWAASALVLGTAWVFGRRSMAKKDSMNAEIEVARTIGVVGGANDFGQDPVMIQESNKRHFSPMKFSGQDKLDPSSPNFSPLSQSYEL